MNIESRNDFKYDLKVGQLAEKTVGKLLMLDDSTIEVKLDLLTQKTGNIAIEYRSRGKKSGISTTKAKYWAFVISIENKEYEEFPIVVITTEYLKEIARKYYKLGRTIRGGDNNTSEMVLVPIKDIFKGNINKEGKNSGKWRRWEIRH